MRVSQLPRQFCKKSTGLKPGSLPSPEKSGNQPGNQPGNGGRHGYTRLNKASTREISLPTWSPTRRAGFSLVPGRNRQLQDAIQTQSLQASSLSASYALQSVQLEDSQLTLGLGDSIYINDHLASTPFRQHHLASTSAGKPSRATLPDVGFVISYADGSQVVQLRNQLVACWITETTLKSLGTAGIDEDQIRDASALVIEVDIYRLSSSGSTTIGSRPSKQARKQFIGLAGEEESCQGICEKHQSAIHCASCCRQS